MFFMLLVFKLLILDKDSCTIVNFLNIYPNVVNYLLKGNFLNAKQIFNKVMIFF